jgi:hypothetical protein
MSSSSTTLPKVISTSKIPIQVRPKKRRGQQQPYPNTILDTQHLLHVLDELQLYGSAILPIHIQAFYQALHRQHYPSLSDFVQQYYRNERRAQQRHHQPQQQQPVYNELQSPPPQQQQQQQHPLRNRLTQTKNLNRMQLPKALLDFLRTTEQFVTMTSTVVQIKHSRDTMTTKLIVQLHDAQYIECVIMRYVPPTTTTHSKHSRKSKTGYGNGRATLCVSSQCGCAMGCTVTYKSISVYVCVCVCIYV